MADDLDGPLDYDETDEVPQTNKANGSSTNNATGGASGGQVRGSYVSIHASGFKDFLLKPELLRAIMDCGFEHPSEGLTKPTEVRLNSITILYI